MIRQGGTQATRDTSARRTGTARPNDRRGGINIQPAREKPRGVLRASAPISWPGQYFGLNFSGAPEK